MVLQGSPRSPDIHDLSECHHLYDLRPLLAAKSRSYQFNSLNFDSKKISVRSVEDHLNRYAGGKRAIIFYQEGDHLFVGGGPDFFGVVKI